MATPLMAGLESQGIASHGPMPAGMLRIQQGTQERYIWPVHLPGWLAMGWRVAGAEGPSIGVAAAEPSAPAAGLNPVPAVESPGEPATTRGRRGRRRKEELQHEQPPAAVEPHPALTGAEPEQQADADSEPPPVDAAADQDSTEAEPSSESEPAITALPDDLFNDPLI
jgi:hypothetical protein